MKAIILASGIGKRLRPLTYEVPKSLIKILEDKTILGHQLDNLIGCGITNIIITTGPFEDKIKVHVKEKYPDLEVSYVNNPKYETTNNNPREVTYEDVVNIYEKINYRHRLTQIGTDDKDQQCQT